MMFILPKAIYKFSAVLSKSLTPHILLLNDTVRIGGSYQYI